jgi:hypothetical protein
MDKSVTQREKVRKKKEPLDYLEKERNYKPKSCNSATLPL